jgi:alpha-L-glutamate ligase-like protein
MFSVFSMFASPKKLHAQDVMGMNKRNNAYIGCYYVRSKYSLVDDKFKTKIIAQAYGAVVPKLIGVITQQVEVKHIHKMVKHWPEFVIKPARGSGGKGILVIIFHQNCLYIKLSW